MGYAIIYMLLAFPSSLIVYIAGGLLVRLPTWLAEIIFSFVIMTLGYFQWFIILPWWIKKFREREEPVSDFTKKTSRE